MWRRGCLRLAFVGGNGLVDHCPLSVSFGWVPDVTQFNALANSRPAAPEGHLFCYLHGAAIRPPGIAILIVFLMGVVISSVIKSAISPWQMPPKQRRPVDQKQYALTTAVVGGMEVVSSSSSL